MKKFIIKVAIFSFLILIIAFGLDYHISHFLRYDDDRRFKTWGDFFNQKLTNEVVINGTSRAWEQFNPIILDTILHTSAYNLGLDGSAINRQIPKNDYPQSGEGL